MARTLEVVDDLEEMEALEGLVERVKDGRYIAEAIVFWWGLVGLIGLIGEVGLKLEGFEDVMFWLCALWKTVDGLMGEDNMRQRHEGILIPTRPS
jgi:hypothetical protein